MKINIYFTHIEISPYSPGDNPGIEKSHSSYDKVYHQYIPLSYYVDYPILYLPRGENINRLENIFPNSEVTVFKKPDEYDYFPPVEIMPSPRDRIQEDAIKFLMCEDRFYKGNNFTQFGLNLDTGDGKTICMIHAICRYHIKSIIICHQSKIKKQWYDAFINMTSIDNSRIIDIDGSECMEDIVNGTIEGDIYIVNHQTIASYANIHGWTGIKDFFRKTKIGIKVFDEAHKFFNNILMVDFFSNTRKTFYLTATFKKNRMEQSLFKRAFSNLYRFGEETMNYEEKRKHVIYVPVRFHSYPKPEDIIRITSNTYNFSVYEYTDYAIKRDKTILYVMLKYIRNFYHLRGKILVISAKKDSCEIITEFIKQNVLNKSVDFVHSGRSKEENEKAYESDIIVSTMNSVGTGLNIKYLRIIINMEPHSSETNCLQLKGRLREFSPTDDTFLIDLIDMSFKSVANMAKQRERILSKSVKEIIKLKE